MTRDECLERAIAAVTRARAVHRRCRVLRRGRDAKRRGFSLPRRRSRDRRRRDDGQPAGYGRLFHAGRDRRVLPIRHRPCAERGQGRVQRALPRRSGPGRREHDGGDWRRRAPGRMHDQRHRRTRGQRLAGRNRHGHASPSGPGSGRHLAYRHPPPVRRQPAPHRSSPENAFKPTKPSSGGMPSRTKRVFTRTAC